MRGRECGVKRGGVRGRAGLSWRAPVLLSRDFDGHQSSNYSLRDDFIRGIRDMTKNPLWNYQCNTLTRPKAHLPGPRISVVPPHHRTQTVLCQPPTTHKMCTSWPCDKQIIGLLGNMNPTTASLTLPQILQPSSLASFWLV